MHTVFHVSTPDQLSYVDAKVRNLLADATLEVDRVSVVVDSGRVIDRAAGPQRDNVEAVLAAGGRFAVCSNALAGASSGPDALPDGVEFVSSGVGELTRLQDAGASYIRP